MVEMKEELGAMAWRAPEVAMPNRTVRPIRKPGVYSLGMGIIKVVVCAYER